MNLDKIYKALADNNRRLILMLLREKEYSVNEMLEYFKITQATLSCHLSVLRKAKLVEVRVLGKQRFYRLLLDNLRTVVDDLGFGSIYRNSRRVNLLT